MLTIEELLTKVNLYEKLMIIYNPTGLVLYDDVPAKAKVPDNLLSFSVGIIAGYPPSSALKVEVHEDKSYWE